MTSLRDQLLKTGLVSKEQAKKAETQAKSKIHQQQKQKKKKRKTVAVDTESAAYLAAKAREDEIAHAKELNRQKDRTSAKKELTAQVHDLIQSHQVNDDKADITYHFTEGQFVKQISVNANQQQQLTSGQLAITVLEDSYYLVPASIAEKLLERAPETVRYFSKDEEKSTEADDWYADYTVPDDLMW